MDEGSPSTVKKRFIKLSLSPEMKTFGRDHHFALSTNVSGSLCSSCYWVCSQEDDTNLWVQLQVRLRSKKVRANKKRPVSLLLGDHYPHSSPEVELTGRQIIRLITLHPTLPIKCNQWTQTIWNGFLLMNATIEQCQTRKEAQFSIKKFLLLRYNAL
jgi:hypothetical protein